MLIYTEYICVCVDFCLTRRTCCIIGMAGNGVEGHMTISTSGLTPTMRRQWEAQQTSAMDERRKMQDPRELAKIGVFKWDRNPHYQDPITEKVRHTTSGIICKLPCLRVYSHCVYSHWHAAVIPFLALGLRGCLINSDLRPARDRFNLDVFFKKQNEESKSPRLPASAVA